ncbi:dual specificity protein phosphatase 3-like [Folsomia candida]|uniref:dual specificity protein phosphatase 3-like n=1 Tax=Folsomia candida TaxID=158441 RepID=UPI000B8F8528|nr:dual specificity protein phosphatase 3-like [Folsomia candida]
MYSSTPLLSSPRPKIVDWNKKSLEVYGMNHLINGPTTPEVLKDLVSDRWRPPHKSCEEVYPKIYVGSERAAKDVPLLKSLGITHIINAACTEVKTGEVFYLQQGHRFTLLTIDISDSPTANISTYFEEVNRFIEVALHTGGKVLVHGKDGVSRSATLVIAYLMMRKKQCALEAVRNVRRKRHVNPTDGFLRQICDLDDKLRKDQVL